LAGRFFRLTAFRDGAPVENFVFQVPIRLVIEYREADLGDIAEENLELRYYDSTTGEWRTDGIVVEQRDPVRNLITVTIAHLSEFALTGAARRIFLPVVSRQEILVVQSARSKCMEYGTMSAVIRCFAEGLGNVPWIHAIP
jgi:hypothetical protein